MARQAVGSGLQRTDGPAKVRGAARYPQDLPVPEGCLYAVAVRAPVPHARVHGIRPGGALSVPGVRRVLTWRDVRGSNRYGLMEPDQPVLAEDRVLTVSDVVALVVADSERSAREGARRVRLDLTPLPALTDPARACEPSAPVLHPERPAVGPHPNVVAVEEVRQGDPERVLAQASIVIEGDYETGWVEHAFLGPEAGIAAADGSGRLTLWVATQWPEEDLRQAARALGEPLERLRIVQTAIGGAFGGREDVSLQILLLLAARETGAPVRMVWDREESIRGHGKRHPFRMRYRLGADRDGRLLAVEADLLADAGGYASTSAAVLANAVSHATGPYAVAHVLVRGRAVYTNNPVTCAFRGFGVNQVTFAMEQQMNRLAERLGLHPAEVRRRNLPPTAQEPGAVDPQGLRETLDRAVERAEAAALPPSRGPWRYGRGLASAVKNVGYSFGFDDHATARVTLTQDGAVVRTGAAEVGQGVEMVLAQIAAQTLDLPPERVRVEWQDTAAAPEAGSTSASHQTFVTGNAVRLACLRARRTVEDLGGVDRLPPGGITVIETYHAPKTVPLRQRGRTHYAYSWSTCVADVAVDVETGRVRVLRLVEAVDAGRVINPLLFAGQVEGGAVMAQGYAIQERFEVRDGVPLTRSLGACNIPTAVDAAPVIETLAVETPDPNGPYGARGIGEVTMLPVVPAITAAIHAATGAWVDRIPATPERVLAALESSGAPDLGAAPNDRPDGSWIRHQARTAQQEHPGGRRG
ncbi:MAG TPA: xanthine dehydrogenase family protein molybdopterin-binding subunit [Dehalococcoidia bacterium]